MVSPFVGIPSRQQSLDSPKAYGVRSTIIRYGMSGNDTLSTTDAPCAESPGSDAIATTEAYETDEGVVFYDANNPLAWLHARATITLEDAV